MKSHNSVKEIRLLWPSVMLVSLFFAPVVSAENYPALLQWSQRVELSTPLSGVIRDVMVQPGEKVAKGTVLLQLDDQLLISRVKSAQANLRNQEEHYKEIQRELDRTTELYNRTLISEHELQVAKNNEAQAKAELEKARTAVVQSKSNMQYSQVRAPFNVLILERNAEPGKVISAELKPEALLIVAESDRMQAQLYVNESKLSSLSKGQAAQVHVNDKIYTATVKSIGLEPVMDKSGSDAARYAVTVEFSVTGKLLRAGQKANVDLP